MCAALDAAYPEQFVGTLAGDDTILVVCRDAASALETQEEFRKYLNR